MHCGRFGAYSSARGPFKSAARLKPEGLHDIMIRVLQGGVFAHQLCPALALLVTAACPALALDPRDPAISYLRTTFTTEDGLGANIINAILQTRDGFLWIATSNGLTRFDGRHFSDVSFAHDLRIQSMAEGADGDLWLGMRNGIRRLSPHIFDKTGEPQMTDYHLGGLGSGSILRLHFARDGTLWAGSSNGLYRWNGAGFTEIVSGINASRIEETLDRHILVPSRQGFLEWDGARAVDHPEIAPQLGLGPDQVYQVVQDRQGAMWFSAERGLFRRLGRSMTRVSGAGSAGASFETYEDHNGNLWISMASGVYRVRGDSLEAFAPGTQCRALLADRDGGLWIGTNGSGLIHVKDRTVNMFTTADGLRSDIVMAVLTDHSGKLWVAGNCGGIAWFDGTRFHPAADKGHRADCAYSLAEDRNHDIFVGTYADGLFRLHNGQLTEYLKAPDLPSDIVVGLLSARDGSLWIATPRGLTRMRDGRLRTYTTADGLSSDSVDNIFQDSEGTIWAGTSNGVNRLVGDRFSLVQAGYFAKILGEYRGNIYIGLRDRVIRIERGKISETFPGLLAWSMIARFDELWLAAQDGILRTTAEDLSRWENDRGEPLDYTKFTRTDGMQSAECTSAGGPHMTITADGRLWVATEQGLARIDLPHLQRNADKTSVYIRDIIVGRNTQQPGDRLVLPAGTSHVELDFDPVELSSPDRIRLQYRLDGVDDEWLDAPGSHVATYSSMPPGPHTFHVRATNRDGVWDRVGTSYLVMQQPYVYQTAWFRALSVAAMLAVLWGLYRYRMRQVAREFNVRLEERVSERTRLARDLHDTLLQSFQGLMLRFQVVDDLLPEGKAKEQLEQALHRADEAIAEGRNAVYDLRSSATTANDLAQAVKSLGDELATTDSAAFHLVVEGTPRHLHPIIRDEIYRITREALRNAFSHGRAHHIETEITYGKRAFRLRIRDDGEGIPPEILKEGRPGHYGLSGMRERAKKTGGKLDIWSGAGAGTEIELSIAGSIAYRTSTGRRPFRLFGKRVG
jgi:signal transduction histidine kinase/ligand-binding sensor domain-containing protein